MDKLVFCWQTIFILDRFGKFLCHPCFNIVAEMFSCMFLKFSLVTQVLIFTSLITVLLVLRRACWWLEKPWYQAAPCYCLSSKWCSFLAASNFSWYSAFDIRLLASSTTVALVSGWPIFPSQMQMLVPFLLDFSLFW